MQFVRFGHRMFAIAISSIALRFQTLEHRATMQLASIRIALQHACDVRE